jgi:chemotaxis protein methyltransferase CheR
MTDADFDFVRRMLLDKSAIALEPGKQYLVESRLLPVAKQRGMASIAELVRALRIEPGSDLIDTVVQAMVTTETSFFRDFMPFETLRKTVLPELLKRREAEKQIHIWFAASSTGQEPYSVALLLKEYFSYLVGWKITLLATDISREVLAKARDGRYTQIEVNRGMPASLLVKYFKQLGTTWQINDDIRAMVEFRELNLSRIWPALPRLDIVFIRNVMIYFDIETKKAILGRIARLLRPDGYLLLGGAETTFNLDDAFRRCANLKSGFYQLAT